MSKYQPFLEYALDLTKIAEASILPLYQNCEVGTKSDGTEVTQADRQAELAIREKIAADYPGHGILGEEFGAKDANGEAYQWVIDPVDGTAWFTLGMPVFGTLVALLQAGEPVVGVIHFPVLQETVYAATGEGCWFKPRGLAPYRVRVDVRETLSDAVASASGAHSSDIQHDNEQTPYSVSNLINAAKKFKFCTDCLQHALVCRGRVHAAVDTVMSPWDIAAIVPCVEEAGGVASNLEGRREGIVFGGSLLTSCGPQIHEQALSLLQPQFVV